MEKCVKCGGGAIRTGKFVIGSKDVFSFVKFEGAAEVGICGKCAKPYMSKKLTKLLLSGIGMLIVGLFFLIVALNEGLKGNVWAFVFMITGLGSGALSILSYVVNRSKISDSDQYLANMNEEDVLEITGKVLSGVSEIKEGVIANWPVLNSKRNAVDFSNPGFLNEIRRPFAIGTTGSKIELYRIGNTVTEEDYMPVPGYGNDKTLDAEGTKLIRLAIINDRENN